MTGLLRAVDGLAPTVSPEALIAPGAVVAGRVTLAADVNVWYQAVIRGDEDEIRIDAASNVQDGVVIHTDAGFPVRIGRRVQIGHNAVVHGAVIEDEALIGIGAVVLNGSHVGARCVVAAGSVVLPGTEARAGWVIAGTPAKPLRPIGEQELEWARTGPELYVARARRHGFDAGTTS